MEDDPTLIDDVELTDAELDRAPEAGVCVGPFCRCCPSQDLGDAETG